MKLLLECVMVVPEYWEKIHLCGGKHGWMNASKWKPKNIQNGAQAHLLDLIIFKHFPCFHKLQQTSRSKRKRKRYIVWVCEFARFVYYFIYFSSKFHRMYKERMNNFLILTILKLEKKRYIFLIQCILVYNILKFIYIFFLTSP